MVQATGQQSTSTPVAFGRRRRHWSGNPALTGFLMTLPVLALVAVFTIWPFGRAIYQSTRIESPIFPPQYVGFQNYRDVWGSFYFRDAAENSLLFALATVPALLMLGVMVALLLNEPFVGNTALRIGMLSLLVPAAELDAAIDGLAGHLLAGGPQAHGKIKELIRAVAGRPIDHALMADTARRIADIRVSPEGREGIGSFLDKRKPGWCSPGS